jgi:tetratricopeptide (TPR) repeat protein
MSAGEFDELMKDASWALLQGQLEEASAVYADAERAASTAAHRAQVLEGRANVLIKQGKFEEAKHQLKAALDLFGASAPPSTWGNLGFTLDKLGEFDEALLAHRNCIASHEATDGAEHPRTLRKLGDLAYSLTGLGRLDEAESVLQKMVHGFESQPGREPLWHAKALSSLGYFYLRSRHDPEAALECLDRAENLRDACALRSRTGKILKEGFPATFEADLVSNRAETVAALGRVEEAAQLRARWELLTERSQEGERLLREG